MVDGVMKLFQFVEQAPDHTENTEFLPPVMTNTDVLFNELLGKDESWWHAEQVIDELVKRIPNLNETDVPGLIEWREACKRLRQQKGEQNKDSVDQLFRDVAERMSQPGGFFDRLEKRKALLKDFSDFLKNREKVANPE